MHKLLIAVWAAAAAVQCAPAWPADAATSPVVPASRECDVCPEMVSIPGGEFMMGSPAGDSEGGDNEHPQRAVRVKPFALGKTEITLAQWREFARVSGYKTQAELDVGAQGCLVWAPDDGWAWRAGRSWHDPGWPQNGGEPVVCISWVDAQTYVRWLDENSGVKGWRLPSEAEWEYAARAGSTTRRPWSDDEVSCVYANGTDRTIGPRGRTWTGAALCKDAIGSPRLWDATGRTPGVCTICWATCGNGCRTVTCRTRMHRAMAALTRRRVAGAVYCAAVRGTSRPRCCARPSDSSRGRHTEVAMSGCGWRGRCRLSAPAASFSSSSFATVDGRSARYRTLRSTTAGSGHRNEPHKGAS